MREDVGRVIDRFAGCKVLIVGDAILDRYLEGESLRFCREAPVPNVGIARIVDRAGGGANTAVNVRALGAQADFLSVVGSDAEGDALEAVLHRYGVGCADLLRDATRRTRAKHRVTAEGQLLLSFDLGDTTAVVNGCEKTMLARLRTFAREYDLVIVADYGYGAVTPSLIDALRQERAHAPFHLAVDSRRRLQDFRETRPDVVKPNFEEAQALLGHAESDAPADRAAWVAARQRDILARTGASLAAVTLDRDGALLCASASTPRRVYAPPVSAPLAAGAGDTFVATLALSLAVGSPADVAGELAVHAASIAVAKEHTSACSAAELCGCFAPQRKVVDGRSELHRIVADYRAQGRRIVLTNGCFDILHRGHVALLCQAKALGDVLIVGVNGDESIRRVKGAGRPINGLADRLQVLSAIGCVDHVVAFHEETARDLVSIARPDVFVKGGSWTRDTLPETAIVESYGGKVHLLPYLADLSTTQLIERISGSLPAMLAG